MVDPEQNTLAGYERHELTFKFLKSEDLQKCHLALTLKHVDLQEVHASSQAHGCCRCTLENPTTYPPIQ